ncbi:MAG: RNA methyltransferase [Thermoanaerobaculia bacterium]
MLIYGFHPVREALRHRPHEIERVLVSRRGTRRRQEIERLCRRHQVPCEPLSERELSRRTGGVHNGFAAELSRVGGETRPTADPELLVLLEDVQDPRNLGALLRVFEGAGVAKVLLRDRGSAPVSPAVVRTSAGAVEWLEIERVTNAAHEIERLKREGFWVYGADARGVPPWRLDLTGKLLLCFGGEAKGLRPRTRQLCDQLIGLPMRGRIASLNVSAAAAAVVYEAVRQRADRVLQAGPESR